MSAQFFYLQNSNLYCFYLVFKWRARFSIFYLSGATSPDFKNIYTAGRSALHSQGRCLKSAAIYGGYIYDKFPSMRQATRTQKLPLSQKISESLNSSMPHWDRVIGLNDLWMNRVAPSSNNENPFLRWRRNERTITFDESFYGYLEVAREPSN